MSKNSSVQLILTSGEYKSFHEHWKERIALVEDYPGIGFFEGNSVNKSFCYQLSAGSTAIIKRLVNDNNMGVFVVFVSALNELFSRVHTSSCSVFRTPLLQPDSTNGLCDHVLLISKKKEHQTIKQLLQTTQQNITGSYKYQDYPITDFIPRNDNHIQLAFDALHEVSIDTGITISRKKEGFELYITSKIGLEDTVCTAFFSALDTLLSAYHLPDTPLDTIQLVHGEEANDFLSENTTAYPKNSTLQQLFEEQAVKHSDHVALYFNDSSLTYSRVNEKANQLAHYLRENGDIQRGNPIALLLDRSPEMIISILAILKAGGAYVPLDPSFPVDRIRFMMNDAGVKAIITHSDYFELLAEVEVPVFITDLQLEFLETGSENPTLVNTSSDPAYIIYTSGSTGTPKGNLTFHYNVARLVKQTDYIGILPQDCLLQLSNVAFDGSVFDIFGALLNGASLQLIDKKTLEDTRLLKEVFPKVTIAFVTTALFNTLTEIHMDYLKGLRKLLFGGERVSVRHVQKALEALGEDKLIHVYGPTENTVFTTAYPIRAVEENQLTIPIGRAIANTQVYILDAYDQLLPKGLPGEICVSGDGLGGGYLNREELNGEKFTPHPFKTGEKLYRTGDLGRWNTNGEIEFLDRIDQQVKVRGFRIELGEIETAILKNKAVNAVFVMVRKDAGGDDYLAAYYSSDTKDDLHLKEHLRDTLPSYMIPSHFIRVEQLPLTSNGKIDKNALADPLTMVSHNLFQHPENETEAKLLEIWKEVIGMETISTTDNFFEIGGNSLKATVLVSKIHRIFHVDIPLMELFDRPTIQQAASYISTNLLTAFEPIQKAEEQEYYPLSSVQKRIYILHELAPDQLNYNTPLCFQIKGRIDIELLENAINTVIGNYEIYCTSFHTLNGEVVQQVKSGVKISLQQLTGKQVKPAFEAFVQPFDLSTPPFIRAAYFESEKEGPFLFMDLHHIISDGVSFTIFLNAISLVYGQTELPEMALQYKDFAVWQEQFFQTDAFEAQRQFWLSQFKDGVPDTAIPKDFPRPAIQNFEGKTVFSSISESITTRINELCQYTGTTPFMVYLAAYQLLICKYTNQTEVVTGTPVSGRSHADLHHMPGVFINTLALRSSIDPNDTFLAYLDKIKSLTIAAFDNQDYPFEVLVQELKLERDLSRNPIFDHLFAYQDMDMKPFSLGDTPLEFYSPEYFISKFDLSFSISAHNDNFQLGIEYANHLFREDTIERLQSGYFYLLTEVLNNPAISIDQVELLSSEEQSALIHRFNPKPVERPVETIVGQFRLALQGHEQDVAFEFENRLISYDQLNRASDAIAQCIQQQTNQPNPVVAIRMQRSTEMIFAIYGILKAGGAYVPVDPGLPQKRIDYLLEHSGAVSQISDASFFENQTSGSNQLVPTLALNDLNRSVDGNLPVVQPDDLAYIIYTSGSTGKPKGVMVEHRSVAAHCRNLELLGIQKGDSIAAVTSLSFDISVLEIIAAINNNVKVLLLSREDANDPERLLNAVESQKVNCLQLTPSRLTTLLAHPLKEALRHLKTMLIGGETLHASQADELLELGIQHLFNVYGPTETTVWSTYWKITPGTLSIGNAFPTERVYVLNQQQRPVPIGVGGEIYISGEGVARGYINNDVLNETFFLTDPFFSNSRMYRTGDSGKWLPNGDLVYTGRIDDQLKLRGHRIEPVEIATVLEGFNGLHAAVVTLAEIHGENHLVAYYTAEHEFDTLVLQNHLREYLPEFMIPSAMLHLPEIPLNINGKVDKKQLPAVGFKPVKERKEALSAEEKIVWKVWSKVLKTENLGISDNFFEIGGHSLKATQLVAEIFRSTGITLSLRTVFQHPTIEEQAHLLNAQSPTSQKEPLAIVPPREFYPLSGAQKRMFILQQFGTGQTSYNMPMAVQLTGDLKVDKLREAFGKLVARHGILRTSFCFHNAIPVQRVHDAIEVAITLETRVKEEIGLEFARFIQPFKLNETPLIRMKLLQQNSNEYVLFLDIHHIISDGISNTIILEELLKIYSDEPLPEVTFHYTDYAVYQESWLQSDSFRTSEAHWLNRFRELPDPLNVPLDFIRPAERSFNGNLLSLDLDKSTSDEIQAFCKQQQVTFYSFMMTGYLILLQKWSGKNELVIGSPVSGRTLPETQHMPGIFTNTLACNFKIENDISFKKLLHQVHEQLIDDLDHQDYPFEELVEKLNIPKSRNRNPLFDFAFVLQNMEQVSTRNQQLNFEPLELHSHHSKFDCTLTVVETDRGVRLYTEYCTDLFKQKTIERLMAQYCKLVTEIVREPGANADTVTLVEPAEKEALLQFNRSLYPKNSTLQQLFEEQAVKHSDHVALYFEDSALTYSRVNEKANQLAHYLRENGDIQRGNPIALLLDRSPEMIISILAILKAGGAYVPLDPSFPVDRIRFMMNDAGVKAIITHSDYFELLAEVEVPVFITDLQLEFLETGSENPTLVNTSSDPAYIIYTSGSTGTPKGNLTFHYNVARLVKQTDYIDILPQDCLLQLSNVAFDGSVFDIFGALLNGASLQLIDKKTLEDTRLLKEVFPKVTIAFVTTALFNTLTEIHMDYLKGLRKLLFGGERVSVRHVQKALEALGEDKLIHVYGPTENTVFTTAYPIRTVEENQLTIPIGRAIANTQVCILDAYDQLLPKGLPGEICVSGDGLGGGYLNREELNGEKFTPHPFKTGEKLYRTGDLGRWNTNGEIEFLDRIDQQVKVRGFRIELGEIETAILKNQAVNAVFVMVRKDAGGDDYLAAYYSSDTKDDLHLKEYLRDTLPSYMIPSHFIWVEQLPLTSNGKIDKKALTDPLTMVSRNLFQHPENETEAQLLEIWKEVIGMETISTTDNFFEIGGNSLKLVMLLNKVQSIFGSDISISEAFACDSLQSMAQLLQGSEEKKIVHQLNASTARNVFLFPPGLGLAIAYKELASNIDYCTIHAFDYLASGDRIDQYIQLILDIQPQGPYILGGYSAGGNLAFDVSHAMEQKGLEVKDLILLDSYRRVAPELLVKEEIDTHVHSLLNADYSGYHYSVNDAGQLRQVVFEYFSYFFEKTDLEVLKATVHLITATEDLSDEFRQRDAWKELPALKVYQGAGKHNELLLSEYLVENVRVLKEVLR